MNHEWLYGRGAIDNKGQLVCMLILLVKMWEHYRNNDKSNKLPSFVFTILGDEEQSCKESARFLQNFDADFKIDLEPTGNEAGVFSNEITGTNYFRYETKVIQMDDQELSLLKYELDKVLFTHHPELNVKISSSLGILHVGTLGDIKLSKECKKEVHNTILKFAPVKSAQRKGAHEHFVSDLSPAYESKLNQAFINNFKYECFSPEHGITDSSGATWDNRKVALNHNFMTAFRCALGGRDEIL